MQQICIDYGHHNMVGGKQPKECSKCTHTIKKGNIAIGTMDQDVSFVGNKVDIFTEELDNNCLGHITSDTNALNGKNAQVYCIVLKNNKVIWVHFLDENVWSM